LILYNAWGLVRDSVDILLEGTPSHINLESVKTDMLKISGVQSIHDLHIWTLTSGLHALSCHAVISDAESNHKILKDLSYKIKDQYHIEHATIQLEICCPLSSDNLNS
jgi:cobalt-zinc-cadmium efflux system protein